MADGSVYVFIGAYGSGKTETALSFARREREQGRKVSLVDLDIVNPYFRSRDAASLLASSGLWVISSAAGLEQADIPALAPAALGVLRRLDLTLVFDVGGDSAGARALGRFEQLLALRNPEIWVVVNSYRPETQTAGEVVTLVQRLAEASRQEATGLVANPNLGPETDLAIISNGRQPIQEAAEALGLPVVFTCVRDDLAPAAVASGLGPLLPLRRLMLLPWEKRSQPEGEEGECP